MKQRLIFSFPRDNNEEGQKAILEAYENKENPCIKISYQNGTEMLYGEVFIERIFHWSSGNSTVVFNIGGYL